MVIWISRLEMIDLLCTGHVREHCGGLLKAGDHREIHGCLCIPLLEVPVYSVDVDRIGLLFGLTHVQ